MGVFLRIANRCSMSVFAKPGVATEPLHHPIKLTGIDPETTIYINRLPPPFVIPLEKFTFTSSAKSATINEEKCHNPHQSSSEGKVVYGILYLVYCSEQ